MATGIGAGKWRKHVAQAACRVPPVLWHFDGRDAGSLVPYKVPAGSGMLFLIEHVLQTSKLALLLLRHFLRCKSDAFLYVLLCNQPQMGEPSTAFDIKSTHVLCRRRFAVGTRIALGPGK